MGNNTEPVEMVRQLRAHFRDLRPVMGSRHGQRKIFVFKHLDNVSHVFVRVDAVRGPLQNPYEGPFPVVCRSGKTFIVRIRGKDTTISIDRLKPAYVFEDKESTETQWKTSLRNVETNIEHSEPASVQEPMWTRSSRIVRFPSRLQVGRE
ncbi:hypothetical protein WN55_10800 [Dufourea novaeangliae]|uniref:Uncharacterized protein n=1 Tax=Dufourea novaeangliae TaxID=178035 RepID=A0A154P826_DUFNO|nr:hypothetical protein WN55_10800 [Dufourea novaeangliae]